MRVVKKIVLFLILAAFIVSSGALIHYILQAYITQKDIATLDYKKIEQDGIMTEKGFVMGKYVDLWKENKDIIGWITIEGTKIDYPVMQTSDDPEYYLRRNFKKDYEISGTPFMDANSDIFIPTQNWLIYGHNMYTGIMFHDLLKYADKEFYESHKRIHFDTIYLGQQAEYEIIAAFYTRINTTGFRYFNYAGMTEKEEYAAYIKGIRALSEYDTKLSAEYGDQLITLSTCSYHVPDKKGRFVVVGKKVKCL